MPGTLLGPEMVRPPGLLDVAGQMRNVLEEARLVTPHRTAWRLGRLTWELYGVTDRVRDRDRERQETKTQVGPGCQWSSRRLGRWEGDVEGWGHGGLPV